MAVIHTNNCLVFQLKREVKSEDCQVRYAAQLSYLANGDQPASMSNLMCAYSSFLGE